MSEQLRVLCVMLTKDRPELARKAVECFRKQTYRNKSLIIFDSGIHHLQGPDGIKRANNEFYVTVDRGLDLPVGLLRNMANSMGEFPVIIHWDDDDYSHPERIADQVNQLGPMAGNLDAVGYRDLMFWRETEGEAWRYESKHPTDVPGTTLCYWRKTWAAKPFENINQGEDIRFVSGLKSGRIMGMLLCGEPAMIGRIHKGNENKLPYRRELMQASQNQGGEWTRVPAWDDYCREALEG